MADNPRGAVGQEQLAAHPVQPRIVLSWDPADYAVAGKTTQMRLFVAQKTYNTGTAATGAVVRLAPVTALGSSESTETWGADLSSVNVGNPALGSVSRHAGTAFTVPAAGVLDITPECSNAPTALNVVAEVQIRHV
jgi:hypothetical protein